MLPQPPRWNSAEYDQTAPPNRPENPMRDLIRRLTRTAWTCICGNTNADDASVCTCGKPW